MPFLFMRVHLLNGRKVSQNVFRLFCEHFPPKIFVPVCVEIIRRERNACDAARVRRFLRFGLVESGEQR
jgi:hypothetical protein